ncbi:MAG: META domain-containing protein [Gaiellaceae bacterium]
MTNGAVTLAYTEWTLVELDGEPVELDANELAPSLVLDLEEARVTGSSGVNRLAGQFALSGDELRFGTLATTRMAGPESAMRREAAFLAALDRVTSYALDGRTLTLLADDEAIVRLSC